MGVTVARNVTESLYTDGFEPEGRVTTVVVDNAPISAATKSLNEVKPLPVAVVVVEEELEGANQPVTELVLWDGEAKKPLWSRKSHFKGLVPLTITTEETPKSSAGFATF